MTDNLPHLLIIAAVLAVLYAIVGYFVALHVKKSMEAVVTRADEVRAQVAELKVAVSHVDHEYIKKMLTRTIDNESAIKKVANDLDLEAEKLKSYINRCNARLPRPRTKEADAPDNDDQQDILEQLKQSGQAIPLQAHNQQEAQPRFVRSSTLRQRRAG